MSGVGPADEAATLAVFGAGGFLLQILPALDALREKGRDVVIVDDHRAVDTIHGYSVLPIEAVPAAAAMVVAIAGGLTRQKIVDRLGDRPLASIVAATALVSPRAAVGEGAIICDHFLIEADARIGRHFHGNIFGYVAHECVVGDYVTFAPRVSCNGNVHVGDHAYVGTGAVIRQGTPDRPLRIGRRAVIGMGAVVTKDVPDDAVVVGNPARPR